MLSRHSLEICSNPGTRYKRRGVDEWGNVANFVETEQVRTFFNVPKVEIV
jgi:hypothetical protein